MSKCLTVSYRVRHVLCLTEGPYCEAQIFLTKVDAIVVTLSKNEKDLSWLQA